ncbi:MAG: RND family transporter [Gemmatimonadota bacterium]
MRQESAGVPNGNGGRELGARWGQWVIRWRWPVIAASLLIASVAAIGGKNLRFGNNYRLFFGENNPQVAQFDALERIYTKNDNILFTVEPVDGDVFVPDVLAAIQTIEERAWLLPFTTRVDALTNFQNTRADQDDLVVEDLVPAGQETDAAAVSRAKADALAEPLIVHRLVNDTGSAAGVNITVYLPDDAEDPAARPALVGAARELAQQIDTEFPAVRVHLTGMIMLNNAFFEASQKDMQTLIPMMYAGIIVLLLILLRSFGAAFGTVVVIGLATVSAVGVAGWAGIILTPPSATAPTVILTLAVADSVHILVTLLQRMRAGLARQAAIIESMRVNLGPVFLTSLTTAIGFLSMNFSDSPPFRDLGNITVIGVLFAFAFSVGLLPAMMSVLPIRARATGRRLFAWEDPLAEFVLRRRRGLMVGTVAVAAALGAFLPSNELNDKFVDYFDESVAFRTDSDYTMDNLTGLYSIEFSVDAGESGGISNPEYLTLLDDFSTWYEAQPKVQHVYSFADVMKRLNRNMLGDEPSAYALPDSRELAAQYLLLYEMSLPFGQDLNNQINVDKSSTRLTVTLEDVSTREMRALAVRGEDWLQARGVQVESTRASGPSLMFAHISGRNIKGMLTGTAVALLLVSLTLVLAFRSFGYGVLSLVPNIAPAALAFGLWGLTVGQINLGLSAVAAMTIGIVVDDTIHFLSKYLRARRERESSPEDSVRFAFHTVGPAMVFTSIILVAGFLVLTLSSFGLNSSMGQLTAITIGFALATDFLMLPPILVAVGRFAERRAAAASPVLALEGNDG